MRLGGYAAGSDREANPHDDEICTPRARCHRGRDRRHGRVVAGQQLPDDRPDLPAGQPAPAPAASPRARQAAPARPLGHGPGLSFVYAHLARDHSAHATQDDLPRRGPGHGGPRSVAAGLYLEGTYSEIYPRDSRRRGRPATARPPVLGARRDPEPRRRRPRRDQSTKAESWATSLAHAFGAAFDNPDLLVACGRRRRRGRDRVRSRGRGRASRFLNPARDGAVLPMLHLNGARSQARPSSGASHLKPRCGRCSRATVTRS